MNQGFIINKYSEKIGDFKDASFAYSGVWDLSDVRVSQEYVNVANKTTKEPYLFVLVEQLDDDSFNITESLGVGFLFSEAESWCSVNDMNFKSASFVEKRGGEYEN